MSKVLLIEDNPDNREIVQTTLVRAGYKVVCAVDGEDGIKKLRLSPNLILLDLSLPKVSGWDVVKKIKDDEKYQHIPVIALTAHAMVGDKEKALESGCNDYLSKPCYPDEIISKVKKWIG